MSARILLVTGRLAEDVVRRTAAEVARQLSAAVDVAVLPISVAALMHADWVRRKLAVAERYDRVILPGWCQGEVGPLAEQLNMPVDVGPKDVRDLPQYLGGGAKAAPDLSRYDIEIVAEINHAPRLSDDQILQMARRYAASGADVIDLGCIPGESWSRAGDETRHLRDEGLRVSIDSFDRAEVEAAVAAGADLVFSVNSQNRDWACDLPAELVVIPDEPGDWTSLEETLALIAAAGRAYLIDPIIEPVGFGFAASLARYYEARRRWPDAEILMGVGNITELLEVDSAGVNMLLAAICQELGIRSVLTTEVINWARSSVAEFDRARRMARYAVEERTLPKHIDGGLVMLRDEKLREFGEQGLHDLAARLKDPNFRVFVERGEIHVMNRDGYWRGRDPFELFAQFSATSPVDPAHAFYLGYELSKATTALTLGKQYTQDQALQWGFLTIPETSRHRSTAE